MNKFDLFPRTYHIKWAGCGCPLDTFDTSLPIGSVCPECGFTIESA